MNYTHAFAANSAKLKNTVWSMSAISATGELVVSLYENWIIPGVDRNTWIYEDDIDSWKGLPHGGNEFRHNLRRAMDGSLTVRLVLARPKTAQDAAMVGNVQDERAIKKTFHVCPDIAGRVESFDGSRLRLIFNGSMPDMKPISTAPLTKATRARLVVWGAGPGMGGISYIEFIPDGDVIKVFGGGSGTDGDGGESEDREEIGQLPVDAGWRERIAFLVNESPPAHEDHVPKDVQVSGVEGLEAKLLALSWSGPEGSNQVATLLKLKDDELEKLSRSRALNGMPCINAMIAIRDVLDHDTDQMVNAVRLALDTGTFSWKRVKECATKVAAQVEVDLQAKAAARRAALMPFEDEIHGLMASWTRIAQRGSGTNSQMMMGGRRGAARLFLEDYTLKYGKLPSGKHRVPWSMGAFDIDIDVLRTEIIKQS